MKTQRRHQQHEAHDRHSRTVGRAAGEEGDSEANRERVAAEDGRRATLPLKRVFRPLDIRFEVKYAGYYCCDSKKCISETTVQRVTMGHLCAYKIEWGPGTMGEVPSTRVLGCGVAPGV